MRMHSQNLNEGGSGFWNGRAWFYLGKSRHDETFHVQWLFGKFARGAAATIGFGGGDNDSELCFHLCVPFLFSIFFVICGVCHPKVPRKTGIAIHSQAIWLYLFVNENGWDSKMKWWEHSHCWNFPWQYDWYSTEILEHKANQPYLANAVHVEKRHVGLKRFTEEYDAMKVIKARVSETYYYNYTLKNGTVQQRKATVFVERMTWRMRWWPLLPFKKVRTSIDITFDAEVGEKTGSWKGGCTGCGYEMKPGETPLECLRRMERERKF